VVAYSTSTACRTVNSIRRFRRLLRRNRKNIKKKTPSG
jgi:hypothetical protein